jgi:hypothetical protein
MVYRLGYSLPKLSPFISERDTDPPPVTLLEGIRKIHDLKSAQMRRIKPNNEWYPAARRKECQIAGGYQCIHFHLFYGGNQTSTP